MACCSLQDRSIDKLDFQSLYVDPVRIIYGCDGISRSILPASPLKSHHCHHDREKRYFRTAGIKSGSRHGR